MQRHMKRDTERDSCMSRTKDGKRYDKRDVMADNTAAAETGAGRGIWKKT